MPKMPQWKPPKDISQALVDGDGFWEDERFAPILVTAMSGVTYQGRPIPIVWQIEFDPFEDDFEAANGRLSANGSEPDGYVWGQCILTALRERNPELAERVNIDDCELSTCVAWVESKEDCQALLDMTWKLVFLK